MQLFAQSKKHASHVHTVLQPQVQKSELGLTKILKKIRVSEWQAKISERTVGRPSVAALG